MGMGCGSPAGCIHLPASPRGSLLCFPQQPPRGSVPEPPQCLQSAPARPCALPSCAGPGFWRKTRRKLIYKSQRSGERALMATGNKLVQEGYFLLLWGEKEPLGITQVPPCGDKVRTGWRGAWGAQSFVTPQLNWGGLGTAATSGGSDSAPPSPQELKAAARAALPAHPDC